MKRFNGVPMLGLVLIGVLVLGVSGGLWAVNADHNRPAPLMDYTPQEIGMHDSSYAALTEDDCRDCHGLTTSTRHHYTDRVVILYACAQPDGCHPPGSGGVTVIRDCATAGCHEFPTDIFTNGWHHNTDLSAPENCVFCHNPNRISQINPDWLDFDLNPPSPIIPDVWSCENCHWAQEVVAAAPGFDPSTSPPTDAGHPSTYDHYDRWGEFAGYHEYGRPIFGNLDTHHMLEVGLYDSACGQCHPVVGTGIDRTWDYGQAHAIRYCMQCHDDLTAHTIHPHVAGVNGWDAAGFHVPDLSNTDVTDVAPTNYRTFDGQEMCIGCHEQTVTDPAPVRPDCTPAIDINSASIMPDSLLPGGIVTLRGECFGEGYTCGSESRVQVKKRPDGAVWMDMPIWFWSDTLIDFELPLLAPIRIEPGTWWVRVKTPGGESNTRVLTVPDG